MAYLIDPQISPQDDYGWHDEDVGEREMRVHLRGLPPVAGLHGAAPVGISEHDVRRAMLVRGRDPEPVVRKFREFVGASDQASRVRAFNELERLMTVGIVKSCGLDMLGAPPPAKGKGKGGKGKKVSGKAARRVFRPGHVSREMKGRKPRPPAKSSTAKMDAKKQAKLAAGQNALTTLRKMSPSQQSTILSRLSPTQHLAIKFAANQRGKMNRAILGSDANGLNPGDPGYDPTTDPNSDQYAGNTPTQVDSSAVPPNGKAWVATTTIKASWGSAYPDGTAMQPLLAFPAVQMGFNPFPAAQLAPENDFSRMLMSQSGRGWGRMRGDGSFAPLSETSTQLVYVVGSDMVNRPEFAAIDWSRALPSMPDDYRRIFPCSFDWTTSDPISQSYVWFYMFLADALKIPSFILQKAFLDTQDQPGSGAMPTQLPGLAFMDLGFLDALWAGDKGIPAGLVNDDGTLAYSALLQWGQQAGYSSTIMQVVPGGALLTVYDVNPKSGHLNAPITQSNTGTDTGSQTDSGSQTDPNNPYNYPPNYDPTQGGGYPPPGYPPDYGQPMPPYYPSQYGEPPIDWGDGSSQMPYADASWAGRPLPDAGTGPGMTQDQIDQTFQQAADAGDFGAQVNPFSDTTLVNPDPLAAADLDAEAGAVLGYMRRMGLW